MNWHFDFSFYHNLCYKYSNGSCDLILNIYISRSCLMVWWTLQSNEFWPLKLFSKDSRVHRDSSSQSESPLGSVWVHSFTFSYILGNVNVTFKLHFWSAPFQAFALIANPRLRLRHKYQMNIFQKMGKFENYIVFQFPLRSFFYCWLVLGFFVGFKFKNQTWWMYMDPRSTNNQTQWDYMDLEPPRTRLSGSTWTWIWL
jgi:hypothetical protein